MKKGENVFYILCGAFLLGLLWRLRGTHGWGSGWGLLSSGFVFLLFLTAVLHRPIKSGFAALCLAAFSFMLTTPGWGTLLESITGVLTVNSKSTDETLQAFVHPASAVVLMLCLGFGLASVFGILTGKYFGGKSWRLLDYIMLLVIFVAVGEVAKASVSHLLVRWIEPQASALFAQGLEKEGFTQSVYSAYMTHYGNMAWAKKILGGRHYYSCVSTISFTLQALSVLLTTRFLIKDRFAARVGALVCSSFAISITLSDLFFFFSKGGYHMQQGFSLPGNVYAWSMWEYCTGFIAGGIITAYLLHAVPEQQNAAYKDSILLRLGFLQNVKLRNTALFLLCFVGGTGLNIVRPIMLRLDETNVQIPCTVLAAILTLIVSILICKKYGIDLRNADYPLFAECLCFFMVMWYVILYLFLPDAQILEIHDLHNCFILASSICMVLWFLVRRKMTRKST